MTDERKQYAQLGEQIRTARLARGVSQETIANVLGISFQQVQKYERGANRIPALRLLTIARLLDYPLSFFFSVADDNDAPTPFDRETLITLSHLQRIRDRAIRQAVRTFVKAIAEASEQQEARHVA